VTVEVGESLDAHADSLLMASRLLLAISARSIMLVDEAITLPQFRALMILFSEGPIKLATLARLLGVQASATGRMVERDRRCGHRPSTCRDRRDRRVARFLAAPFGGQIECVVHALVRTRWPARHRATAPWSGG
jgi:MarR family